MKYTGTGVGGIRDQSEGPDLEQRYADYRAAQQQARAGALRRMSMDFLLPGNRQPDVGGMFNPTGAYGFQLESNKSIPPQVNVGRQLNETYPIQEPNFGNLNNWTPPPTLPGNPMFQGVANQGFGFLIPSNRSLDKPAPPPRPVTTPNLPPPINPGVVIKPVIKPKPPGGGVQG